MSLWLSKTKCLAYYLLEQISNGESFLMFTLNKVSLFHCLGELKFTECFAHSCHTTPVRRAKRRPAALSCEKGSRSQGQRAILQENEAYGSPSPYSHAGWSVPGVRVTDSYQAQLKDRVLSHTEFCSPNRDERWCQMRDPCLEARIVLSHISIYVLMRFLCFFFNTSWTPLMQSSNWGRANICYRVSET